MRNNWSSQGVAVAAVLLLTAIQPLPLYSVTEEARAKARLALAAEEAGRHEDAYKMWTELREMGVDNLGEDAYALVGSHIYYTASMKMAEYGDDCSNSLVWIQKGRQPGPPNYKNVYDVFYAALQIAEGVCNARKGKYEEAYEMLSLAKAELRKAPPEEAAEFMRQADQYLDSVKAHALSEGDYITNKGIMQAWIGKVLSRSGSSVEALITYTNKDLAEGLTRGQVKTFSIADCKILGAVSADAAVKGWRE
jgi:tetratricopeptide (TPR) repeat protein